MQAIDEPGDDPEVAAAAADRPEEIRVAPLVDLKQAAVGRDQLGREHAVDCEPVLAHEVADAAAQGETADPDRGGVPERDREPVPAGSHGDLSGSQAGLRGGDAGVAVDLECGQAREVEHDPALADAVACAAVAAAANRELRPALVRERHHGGNLGRVNGLGDRRRSAVDRRQKDGAVLVVARVSGADHRRGELGAKI